MARKAKNYFRDLNSHIHTHKHSLILYYIRSCELIKEDLKREYISIINDLPASLVVYYRRKSLLVITENQQCSKTFFYPWGRKMLFNPFLAIIDNWASLPYHCWYKLLLSLQHAQKMLRWLLKGTSGLVILS